MLSDEEIKVIARDGAKGMVFILGFATALKKLRQAQKEHYEVSLTPDEVDAVLQAFSLLREGRREP